jgi:hypothetical protein
MEENEGAVTMSRVEVANAMVGLAAGAWSFYETLMEEGFSADQAFKLTMQYLHGVAGGKAS